MSELQDIEARLSAWLHRIETKLGILHDTVKATDEPSLPPPPPLAVPIVAPAPIDGNALILAWLEPPLDWVKVTAEALTVIFKDAITATGETMLDYSTGQVTWQGGSNPAPNFEIQGRVIRGILTTESERAYVMANNADGIGARYTVAADGVVTAR